MALHVEAGALVSQPPAPENRVPVVGVNSIELSQFLFWRL
jgi:hypothetical protein